VGTSHDGYEILRKTESGAAAPAGLAIYLLREIPHMRVNSMTGAI
jgi:hypothetical protein